MSIKSEAGNGGEVTSLSPSEAVERLLAKSAAPEPVAAPEPAAATPEPAQTPSEAASTAEETPSEPEGVNAEGETAENLEPEAPAIEAPHWWAADKKARFSELPSDLQGVVLEQEKVRERAVTKAQQTATDAQKAAETATKAAEAKVAETTQLIERLSDIVPKAEAAFKGKWDGATPQWWAELAQSDPDNYVRYRAQFDADTDTLQRAKDAKQTADADAKKATDDAESARRLEWAQGEAQKLRTLVPDLADPAKAKPLTDRIVAFAKSRGYTDAQIAGAGALEWSLAHDAMIAAEAKASLTTPKPKVDPATPRPAVKPGSAQTINRSNGADSARARLAKTGKPSDAVELLLARMKG